MRYAGREHFCALLVSLPPVYDGDLIFPDKNHVLIAELPRDTNKDSVSEYLIVLASKNRMAHSSEITRSKFFKIINSTPRDSWVMDKISYKIVRKKI